MNSFVITVLHIRRGEERVFNYPETVAAGLALRREMQERIDKDYGKGCYRVNLWQYVGDD